MMFPADKGTYILILQVETSATLTIGRRGTFDFPAAYYAYVGSAFGSGGVRGRLKHHLSPVNKAHWHIDYLRKAAPVIEVWWIASNTRYEHHLADSFHAMPDTTVPVPRFGASDCCCVSHLFHFTKLPDLTRFCAITGLQLQNQKIS